VSGGGGSGCRARPIGVGGLVLRTQTENKGGRREIRRNKCRIKLRGWVKQEKERMTARRGSLETHLEKKGMAGRGPALLINSAVGRIIDLVTSERDSRAASGKLCRGRDGVDASRAKVSRTRQWKKAWPPGSGYSQLQSRRLKPGQNVWP